MPLPGNIPPPPSNWHPLPIEAGGTGGTTPTVARQKLGLQIPSGGASNVTFLQSGTGAVARSVQDKLRDIVALADFDTAGDFDTAVAALPATGQFAFPGIFHIGNIAGSTNTDPQIVVNRAVDDAIAGNGHCFTDSSIITRSGAIGYNSYDALGSFSGANNFNHYSGFQSRPVHNGSGTITFFYLHETAPIVNSGTVTNVYAYHVGDPVGSGVVTNNYGLYVESLTKGAALNFAIYTNSGKVSLGDQLLTRAGGVDITGPVIFRTDSVTSTFTIGAGGSGSNNVNAIIDGSSASGFGPVIRFDRAGAVKGQIGTQSNILGDNSNNIVIYGQTANVAIYANAVLAATFSDTGTAVLTPAGTTALSSLRLPHGSAPTSPVNGDMWTTTSGLFVRINGGTVGPLT